MYIVRYQLKILFCFTVFTFILSQPFSLAEEVFEKQLLLDYRPSAQIETPGPFIALDNSNNLYVAGGGVGLQPWFDDWKIIKYDPNGSVVWTAAYDGPAGEGDNVYAITVDSSGNLYVTGTSIGLGTSGDYTTIKYAADSNQPVWVKRYTGNGDYDFAHAIVVDNSGNVYVTGLSDDDVNDHDCVTIKYDGNGNEAWVAVYDGPKNGYSYDEGTAIALDSKGNIYVTGYSRGQDTNNDYLTIKYDPDSNEPIWIAIYNGPAGDWPDEARAIAIDDNDNIYVTGLSWADGKGYDYATVKYTPDSNQPVWVARYNGPGNDFDIPQAMTLDSHGNIYVTGSSISSGTKDDWATVKYDSNGDELWVARYNSPHNGYERAAAIKTDTENSVYVTGTSGTGAGLTIKYSPDSNYPIWMTQYNNLAESFAHDLALDSSNNVYVAGYSALNPFIGPGEQFIAKYKQCPQSGDMDCDGDVDFYDFAVLGNYWLQNDCGDCGGAEVTGDGNANQSDLKKLNTYWLQHTP